VVDRMIVCDSCGQPTELRHTNGATCDRCCIARGECPVCGAANLPKGVDQTCRCGWDYDRTER